MVSAQPVEEAMIRFLLGVVVGAVGMASYLKREGRAAGGLRTGRVDELSSFANNFVTDPAVNAGDGTPERSRIIAVV